MMKTPLRQDPYLYEDVPVLKNIPGVKDADELKRIEGDLTGMTMGIVYAQGYRRFNTATLCEIHRIIFGDLYDWAGAFRTINIIKPEAILGGDTVRYAAPTEIKKELDAISKEVAKLKKSEDSRTLVFKIVRITAAMWQTHPFREGNTRAVIVFSVLLSARLGIELDYELISRNAAYVRNALVWCTQGIYSNFEYLERIYYDAAGLLQPEPASDPKEVTPYAVIGDFHVATYREQPHIYADEES